MCRLYAVAKQLFAKMIFVWAVNLLLASSLYEFTSAESIFEEAFQVKPGGHVSTVERKIGSALCTFTYAAQGGTNEEWQISLKYSEDEKQDFTCAIYRPGGMSYLFFLQFKLAVTGAHIEDVEVYGEAGSTLNSEEYIVNKERNEVTHAEGKFNSQLSRVLIIGKHEKHKKARKQKHKKEL